MISRVDIKSMFVYGYERDLDRRCQGDQNKIMGASVGCYKGKKLLWVLPLDFKKTKNPKSRIKSLSYPYMNMDLISTLDIIFSNKKIVWILCDRISLF